MDNTQGKLAIVETVLADNTVVTAIEVVIGRKHITISNQYAPLPEDVGNLARQLIEKVRTIDDNSS